jgi:hypothetical protein
MMLAFGCGAEVRLKPLLTGHRIDHKSGVSIPELATTERRDGDDFIQLSYPANHVGRSKLAITIMTGTGITTNPPEAFTRFSFELDSFERIDDTTWFKSSDHQGGKRPSKDVDIVREVNGRWVLLEIWSTVDFQNLRAFSLDFAKSIEISEPNSGP